MQTHTALKKLQMEVHRSNCGCHREAK
uniref:Uncharacterized protein n=1 Tax=Arundo donax TaxID=35708 RepID=A0A0A9FA10_ARUDO